MALNNFKTVQGLAKMTFCFCVINDQLLEVTTNTTVYCC